MSYTPITAEQAREIYKANIPDINPCMEAIMRDIEAHMKSEHGSMVLMMNIGDYISDSRQRAPIVDELIRLGYKILVCSRSMSYHIHVFESAK